VTEGVCLASVIIDCSISDRSEEGNICLTLFLLDSQLSERRKGDNSFVQKDVVLYSMAISL
jgi:hypothetical protein